MQEVFFSNSGAEANEGAIKIARKYASRQGIQNPKIVVAEKSFHTVRWRRYLQQVTVKFRKVFSSS